MTREENRKEMLIALNTWFSRDLTRVEDHWRLEEDLGLDSLDRIDLWLSMEDITKIDIPESEIKSCKTVGEILDTIDKYSEGKS